MQFIEAYIYIGMPSIQSFNLTQNLALKNQITEYNKEQIWEGGGKAPVSSQ